MPMAINIIESLIKENRPSQVVTLNAEIAYKAANNFSLRQIINSAQLVVPDGIGVVWAAKKSGYAVKERVAGIDLVLNLCKHGAKRGWKIYLLGSKADIISQAAVQLEMKYPGLIIAGYHHGYFDSQQEKSIINDINKSAADILLVGLGAPRQEYWINQNKSKLEVPVCIGVGGSFDVISGVKKRAPRFIVKMNLEWLYRLLCEPSRIKRQLDLPRFIIKVLLDKYQKHE